MSSFVAVRTGAQRPQFEHRPAEVVSSAAASEAVDLAAVAGILLDDWQQHVLEIGLGERSDGSWAAMEVAVIVPRQNGKNEILAARELAGIVLFKDDLITHSAHRADTTLEQFRKMEQLAEELPEFRVLVKRISRVNGHEAIELKGDRRIRFVSRQRMPGRGFSGSVVVLDEAFDLEPKAIGAMIPTLSTRAMAQVWYASSPPHDDSIVLHGVRRRGRASEGTRLAYFEWANPAGIDPSDRDAQYAVNPAMGVRISEDFIDAERELMKDIPAEFLREIMGVAEELNENAERVIPLVSWLGVQDPNAKPVSPLVFGFDVNRERSASAIAVSDGSSVELVEFRRGIGWTVDRLAELVERWKGPVALDPAGPAGPFVRDLMDRGVKVVEVAGRDMVQACGSFFDDVIDRRVRIRTHSALDAAVTGATKRQVGDAWTWTRRGADADISPLVAVTVARWVARFNVADPAPQIF
jgi:hypothetical protein